MLQFVTRLVIETSRVLEARTNTYMEVYVAVCTRKSSTNLLINSKRGAVNPTARIRNLLLSCEPLSKLLVSPLISPVVFPI